MSKKEQLSAFRKEHKGEEFTATRLARELGWAGKKGKNFNAKAARKIAKKIGAKIEKVRENDAEPCCYLVTL